jgi:uncharacterized protein YndB with AHSA1/START domain
MRIVWRFDAPRETVWREWTEPDRFARWFGTPPFTTPEDRVSMDVRVAGHWGATMVSPEGQEMPFAGVYREVEPPERLVMTFEDPSVSSDVEVATVEFRDVGGATEMTFRQDGHLPEEQYPLLRDGYSAFFDRLEAGLTR